MPPKKNKKRQKKSKPKEEELPSNDICEKCEDWCSPINDDDPGAVCEDCPHAYHDRCIEEEFQNKNFTNCFDLGKTCDNEQPPLKFGLGKPIEHTAHKTKRKMSTRSKKSHKPRKKKRKSVLPGFHRKTYQSFRYNDVEYKVGDDIIVEVRDEGEQIARIKSIFTEDEQDKNESKNCTMPQMEVLWFWKAHQNEECEQKDTIAAHELHLSENEINAENMAIIRSLHSEKQFSAKALILPSSEEYLEQLKNKENQHKYYGIYWCTHSYNDKTKRKALLPSGAITSHQIIDMSPARNTRKRDRKTLIENALYDAGKSLMLSSVPKRLPCREKEHKEIMRYMKAQILQSGTGSGLYISGMPGTGKTATVRQIANELKQLTMATKTKRNRRNNKDVLPDFDFHEINAMKLPTPRHIYTELAKKLVGTHFAPTTALKKLDRYFSKKDENRKICVLLVDELDYLLDRKQKVMYNIFHWPTTTNGKLVVIGIANTMDLPEKLLPRVSSRMGTSRIVFKAYQRMQLTHIIEDRLQSTKVFTKDAIRYCASAVAGVSGDCRTALQICQRAVEIAQKDIAENGISKKKGNKNKRAKTRNSKRGFGALNEENMDIVTIYHLKDAKAEFEQSNDIYFIEALAIYEKLFLTAVVMYNTQNNGYAGTTHKYRQKFDTFVETRLGDTKMNSVHFRNMINKLDSMGIISISFDQKEWEEFITFNVKIEEAAHALKQNDVCGKLLSTLQI